MAITISGSGIVEANLADNAVTLAKMAGGTDGQIITYDASGNPAAVGPGTDGQILTSTGSTTPPAFETAAAGTPTAGQVVQIVTFTSTGGSNDSGNITWRDTHLNVTITPQYSNSKLYIVSNVYVYSNLTGAELYYGMDYNRTISGVSPHSLGGEITQSNVCQRNDSTGEVSEKVMYTAIDTPSTTSATTYTLRIGGQGSANTVWGWQNNTADTLVITEIKV
jgi:hypothetical protein